MILVGIVALIFLGPRKLPEMARKAGKIMSEFRGTANEFKETWQREVNFEEEAKALDINTLDAEQPVARTESINLKTVDATPNAPEIKEMDPAKFEELKAKAELTESTEKTAAEITNDKKNWL